jgi:hypothetical protein
MMVEIAFLIPVKISVLDKNSKIYKMIHKFYNNINSKYKYNFYLGFNHGDHVFLNSSIFDEFKNEHFNVQSIEFDKSVQLGFLTQMWNILFKIAFEDNNSYFYQLGDDILFDNVNFFDEYLNSLKKIDEIGVTGYLTKNGNRKILTQSFVSRKHYEIFGYYYPEAIRNVYCDDWISDVYRRFQKYKPLAQKIVNSGGRPRYREEKKKRLVRSQIENGVQILKKYLDNQSKINKNKNIE